MAYDRDALLTAVMRNTQATTDQLGLDEGYGRATALRDEAYDQPDRGNAGFVSPLQVLATSMNRSTGRNQMKEVTPLREANRAEIGNTAGELAQGKLGLTLDKEDREVAEHDQKLKLALNKDNRESVKQKHDLEQREGEGETWINGSGGTTAVTYDELNRPQMWDEETQAMVNPQTKGFYPEASKSGYIHGKSMGEKAKDKVSNQVTSVLESRRVVSNWSPAFGQAYRDLPAKIIQSMADGLARNDVLKYLDQDQLQDQNVKAAAQWWADWQMFYTAERRHELFGATLTNNEMKAWDAMLHTRPGMDPAEIEKRIHNLQDAAERSLIRRANIGMQDSLPENRGVWQVAMGDGWAYNSDDNLWSMHDQQSAAQDSSAGPPTDGSPQPTEFTPEQKLQAGVLVQSFDEDQLAKFHSLNPSQQQALLLRLMANGGATQ